METSSNRQSYRFAFRGRGDGAGQRGQPCRERRLFPARRARGSGVPVPPASRQCREAQPRTGLFLGRSRWVAVKCSAVLSAAGFLFIFLWKMLLKIYFFKKLPFLSLALHVDRNDKGRGGGGRALIPSEVFPCSASRKWDTGTMFNSQILWRGGRKRFPKSRPRTSASCQPGFGQALPPQNCARRAQRGTGFQYFPPVVRILTLGARSSERDERRSGAAGRGRLLAARL